MTNPRDRQAATVMPTSSTASSSVGTRRRWIWPARAAARQRHPPAHYRPTRRPAPAPVTDRSQTRYFASLLGWLLPLFDLVTDDRHGLRVGFVDGRQPGLDEIVERCIFENVEVDARR